MSRLKTRERVGPLVLSSRERERCNGVVVVHAQNKGTPPTPGALIFKARGSKSLRVFQPWTYLHGGGEEAV